MDATCNNCDHDWTLRKHPSEYARGSPSCPECGSTRVDVPEAEQAQPQGQPQPQPQPQAQPPAQPQQGQAQGGEMVAQEDAIQHGMSMGDMLVGMGSNDPEEKTVATGKALQMAGATIARMGQKKIERDLAGQERAKQTTNDDIAVADEYPSCPECGQQLTNIPEYTEFSCPGCGVMLELTQ